MQAYSWLVFIESRITTNVDSHKKKKKSLLNCEIGRNGIGYCLPLGNHLSPCLFKGVCLMRGIMGWGRRDKVLVLLEANQAGQEKNSLPVLRGRRWTLDPCSLGILPDGGSLNRHCPGAKTQPQIAPSLFRPDGTSASVRRQITAESGKDLDPAANSPNFISATTSFCSVVDWNSCTPEITLSRILLKCWLQGLKSSYSSKQSCARYERNF